MEQAPRGMGKGLCWGGPARGTDQTTPQVSAARVSPSTRDWERCGTTLAGDAAVVGGAGKGRDGICSAGFESSGLF